MKKYFSILFTTFLLVLLGVSYLFVQNLNHEKVPPITEVPCVSYTPFQGSEAPWQFESGLVISPERFREDLQVLSATTHCVRTYAANGMENLYPVARELGFKVWFGIWIGSDAKTNEKELLLAQKLISQYSDVIHVVVVGNEVLLRGEQTGDNLLKIIQRVKTFSKNLPITYADVWEFWQKNPQIAKVVDVVTIHILPYWENDPISVEQSSEHLTKIYNGVALQFPNRKIAIGEMGWPSRGRSRERAIATASAQYQFVKNALDLCRQNQWDCNVIEAFDQPWKRALEGGVGGAWGLWDEFRQSKTHDIYTIPKSQVQLMFALSAAFLLAGFFAIQCFVKSRDCVLQTNILLVCLAVGLLQGYALSDYLFYTRSVVEVVWHGLFWILPAIFLSFIFASPAVYKKFFPFCYFTFYFVLLAVLIGLAFDGRYRFFPIAPLAATAIALQAMLFLRARQHQNLNESLPVAQPYLTDLFLVLVALLVAFEKPVNTEAMIFVGFASIAIYGIKRAAFDRVNAASALGLVLLVSVSYWLRVCWLQSDYFGGLCQSAPKLWHCQIRSATGLMIHFQVWGIVASVVTACAVWKNKNNILFTAALALSVLAIALYNGGSAVLALSLLVIIKSFQSELSTK